MASPALPSPTHGWPREAGRRLRHLWFAKLLGITGAMSLFFAGYFWVLNHPHSAPFIMPRLRLDELIGFQPAALPVYLSLWAYVSLVPALLVRPRELIIYVATALILSVTGLAIFYFWPTAVPAAAIDWSQHPAFTLLKAADASGNACPSLHVAFAIFSACWFGYVLRQLGAGCKAHLINWVWCLGILYSTVATRQHVVLDVLAGTGLGLLAGLGSRWLLQPVNCPATGTTQR